MERYDPAHYNRESVDPGVSSGLIGVLRGLSRASDYLFTRSEESLGPAEVERYGYENFVVTSQEYDEDTSVNIADIIPEKDQVVVLQMYDKLRKSMGDQIMYYIHLGEYSADRPRLQIRQIHRWPVMPGIDKYETGPPHDVSLVRFFNVKGIGDDIEIKAGSRVVKFEPADSTEFYIGDLKELPESDPVRAAFERAR